MKLAIACILFLLLAGCKGHEIVNTQFAGIILDATVVPTAFNECLKMQIKTTKMVVVLRSQPAVTIGDSAFIVTNRFGWKGFTWSSAHHCYETQGNL